MASTCSNPCPRKYDVFISFRGADIRDGFRSHLFEALCRNQINAFKDENLERGEKIEPAVLQTIEESHVSIVIFSENYAYSSWCLDELVKIMDCKKEMGQIVLPVFYRIDPTHVQELTGSYGDAFVKHAKEFQDKVESWSLAVTETAVMSGFVSENLKPESKLIDEIVKDISKRLNNVFSSDPCDDGLVGIESRLEDVEQLLDMKATDVRVLGIWGSGGIGKTTLASKIFNQISSQFQGQCSITNVREELEHCTKLELQRKFLSKLLGMENSDVGMPIMSSSSIRKWIGQKKVFIVLDDVWDLEVMEFLVGKQHIYAPGSRIIITSRDKGILQNIGAEIYQVKELNNCESLQLFSLHGFKQNSPTKAFEEVARKVVAYAGGNPLALRVLGSNLCGKNEVELWEDQLKKLKNIPDKKIEKILRISYDELDDDGKEIFLDIACLFNSEDKEHVESVLESCLGRYARTGISCLLDKCLINISDKKLEMHDLLRQMGQNIVREECVKNPGNRSRLWNHEDIYRVLSKDMGTTSVESISLDVKRIRFLELSPATFIKMSNLRFLKFYYPFYSKEFTYEDVTYELDKIQWNIRLSAARLNYLPDELRYLYWINYPFKSFPFNFCLKKLIQLYLIDSKVEQLCNENQCLQNLKVLDLSSSINLVTIPNLSEFPKLEVLCLGGCISLVELDSSVPSHDKLSHLDLQSCKNLCRFPKFFEFTNLRFLSLEGCTKLMEFPKVPNNLRRLNLSDTAIKEVPPSIRRHSFLTELRFRSCKALESLPSSIGYLKCLEALDLSWCFEFRELPEVPCNIKSLHLQGTEIQEVPSSIGHCSLLTDLKLSSCKKLESLPVSIGELKCLEILDLSWCSNLRELPELPCNIKSLGLEGTAIQELPSSIGHCSLLPKLTLRLCKRLKSLPSSIGELKCLEELDLQECSKLKNLPNEVCNLKALRYFNIEYCENLNELPENLGNLESLVVLKAFGSGLKMLPLSINLLRTLEYLDCSCCAELILPPLTGLVGLRKLNLESCGMTEISICTGSLVSLTELRLSSNCLQKLPSSIGSLVSLKELHLSGNELEMLPTSIQQLSELQYLNLKFCWQLKCLPKLPSSLRSLVVANCLSLESMQAAGHTNCILGLDASNCSNLDASIRGSIIDEMLERIEYFSQRLKFDDFFQDLLSTRGLCIPGDEVPQRMEYRNNNGSFLQCPLRLDPLDFMVITFCTVLASIDDYLHMGSPRIQCEYNLESDSGESIDFFSMCSFAHVGSAKHVILWHSKIPISSNYIWKKASFKFAVTHQIHRRSHAVVIKCGVHLSYCYIDSDSLPATSNSNGNEMNYGWTETEA